MIISWQLHTDCQQGELWNNERDERVKENRKSKKTYALILQPSVLLQCRVSALLGSGSRCLLLRFDLNDVRYCSLRRCYGQSMWISLISLTALIKGFAQVWMNMSRFSAARLMEGPFLFLLESASHGWVDLKSVCDLCYCGGGVVEVFPNSYRDSSPRFGSRYAYRSKTDLNIVRALDPVLTSTSHELIISNLWLLIVDGSV